MNSLHKKLGEALKLERERRQIKLEDLSSSLKISLDHLKAIENGDDSGLPSPLYFSLFAKSYAESVGIDYDRTMEAIKEELGGEFESQKIPSPAAGAHMDASTENVELEVEKEKTDSSGHLKKLAYILGGIVILFFIYLFLVKFVFSGSSAHDSNSDMIGEATTTEIEGEVSPEESEYDSYDWNVPEYTPAGKITLLLTARNESWATIYTDGDTALFRNLIAGRSYTVTADYRMLVSIAVPSVVEVKLNGQQVDLRDQTSRRISRVAITQINLDSILTASKENPPEPVTAAPIKKRTVNPAADSLAAASKIVPAIIDTNVNRGGSDSL